MKNQHLIRQYLLTVVSLLLVVQSEFPKQFLDPFTQGIGQVQYRVNISEKVLTKPRHKGHTLDLFEDFGYAEMAFNVLLERYPANEIQGFITNDNQVILTAVGSPIWVVGPKPILFLDQYYLAWSKDQNSAKKYKGTITYPASKHHFIPVKAMFHSHVMQGGLSNDDKRTSKKLKGLKQLLLEHGKIWEYNDKGTIREVRPFG